MDEQQPQPYYQFTVVMIECQQMVDCVNNMHSDRLTLTKGSRLVDQFENNVTMIRLVGTDWCILN